MGKIVVMGCGNLLLKDEGFGVHVARELQKMKLPENVKVLDCGTGGLAILDMLREADRTIIVDAMKLGLKPGTVKIFDMKDLPAPSAFPSSAHELDLVAALRVGEELQSLPDEVTVIGAEVKKADEFGADLSEELRKSKDEVIKTILNMLSAAK
ncbi:MAG: hypothetical protein AVW06_03355 [Hadesarchaea archaeon DG-33-1]|nr:MAG: hypothetical protein AVW06_03355 [Hadesarchaea archaeon DG-33-1]